MKLVKILQLSVQPSEQSEFDKDIWDGRKLAADVRVSSGFTIDFRGISQPWLRQATKQYIKYTFATLSWSACRNKKNALKHFSSFLAEYYPEYLASNVNRLVIIEFLGYLVSKELRGKTRLNYLV